MKNIINAIKKFLIRFLSKYDKHGIEPYTYIKNKATYIGISYRGLIKLDTFENEELNEFMRINK